MSLEYGWDFGEKEREPIYVFPVADRSGRRLLGLENVTLSDGSKIEVHIAPLTVDDDEFVQSLSGESGHSSNVKMICHLCVKWGDRDFVLPEDIESEIEAVADVGAAIGQCFPKRAPIIKGRKDPVDDNLPAQRRKLRKLPAVADSASEQAASND